MALALKELSKVGFATAKALVPDAFPTTTVKLGPTNTVDPITNTAAQTWDFEFTGPIFAFDDESKREEFPAETKLRTFLLDPNDFPGAASEFAQDGIVETGAEVWNVFRVTRAPADAIIQVFARR